MASIQLCFTLQTSSMARKVSLLGSWDHYSNQLPLSRDKSSLQPGNWIGTFRFKDTALQPEKRYWYYYLIDGQYVSYNPQQLSIKEPITGRILNILDIPSDETYQSHIPRTGTSRNPTSGPVMKKSMHKSLFDENLLQPRRGYSRDSLGLKVDIPKGRPLSISKIKSPRPITPHATRFILETDYSSSSVQEMTSLSRASIIDKPQLNYSKSPSSISSSSYSSCSDRFDSDSPSSTSSFSDYSSLSPVSSCNCERCEIMQRRDKTKFNYDDLYSSCMDNLSTGYSPKDENKIRDTQVYR